MGEIQICQTPTLNTMLRYFQNYVQNRNKVEECEVGPKKTQVEMVLLATVRAE